MSAAAICNWLGRSASDQKLLNAAKSRNVAAFRAALAGGADVFAKVGELSRPLYEKVLKHILAAADEGVRLHMLGILINHLVERYPHDMIGPGFTGDNVLANILNLVTARLPADQIYSVLGVLHDSGVNFSQQVRFSAGASADLWSVSMAVKPASTCSLLANMYWRLLAQAADALRWPVAAAVLFNLEFLKVAETIKGLEEYGAPALTDRERVELKIAVSILADRFEVTLAKFMSPTGLVMGGLALGERDALVTPIPFAAVVGEEADAGVARAAPIGGYRARVFQAILEREGALPPRARAAAAAAP